MPDPEFPGTAKPPNVSILSQGDYLIVSIHTALDDSQMSQLQEDLINQVGRSRARGIIVDVAAVDLLDSFATRTLSNLARMARLRGAETVVVGIAPEVAITMVQLSLQLDFVPTALDLEEGLHLLAHLTGAPDPVAMTGSRRES
jgi:rsbT antagonist protein RsbS